MTGRRKRLAERGEAEWQPRAEPTLPIAVGRRGTGPQLRLASLCPRINVQVRRQAIFAGERPGDRRFAGPRDAGDNHRAAIGQALRVRRGRTFVAATLFFTWDFFSPFPRAPAFAGVRQSDSRS